MSSRLSLNPIHERPYRWLPRHGEPLCILEWLSQKSIIALAWAPLYTAIVVTVVLILIVFGVPFIGGGR